LGTFWGSITKVCGFKSGTRHGGKVTGLAASGNPDKLIDKFRHVIRCDGMRIKAKSEFFFDPKTLIPDWGSYEPELMKKYIGEATREDVAAAAQKRLEEVVVEMVKNALKVIKCDKIVLAGGVFANVLLNQKILAIDGIDDIFIFPAMSDGGLTLGSAFYQLAEVKNKNNDKFLPKAIGNVYFGPNYTNAEIETALAELNLKYTKMTNPAKELAKLIYDNKIIALFTGRMEYGPRALGNRSIIYAPIDPTANDWLNKRLNRSEFMPFAPVTMIENIKENYIGIVDNPLAAKYMTITYHCTDKMNKDAPACVHIDGTARPQVITRGDNPYYYDIIDEYYKLSGIPTLINTSFNMHEEPIVASPKDAIRAFLDAGLDYLVMEDYLVSYEENK
jgi:carbamoyltransferase